MREASFVQILVPLMDTSYCRMYCYDMVFKPFIIWSMFLICCFQMTGRLVCASNFHFDFFAVDKWLLLLLILVLVVMKVMQVTTVSLAIDLASHFSQPVVLLYCMIDYCFRQTVFAT